MLYSLVLSYIITVRFIEKHSQKKSLKNHAVMKESFSLPLVPQAMEQHLMRPAGNVFDKSSLSSLTKAI